MKIERKVLSSKIKLIIIISQQIISLLKLSTSKKFISSFYFIIIQPHLKYGIVLILPLVSASKRKSRAQEKIREFFWKILHPQDQENK